MEKLRAWVEESYAHAWHAKVLGKLLFWQDAQRRLPERRAALRLHYAQNPMRYIGCRIEITA